MSNNYNDREEYEQYLQLISKFKNPAKMMEIYKYDPLFNNIIDYMLRGGNLYDIVEQLIEMNIENQKLMIESENKKIKMELSTKESIVLSNLYIKLQYLRDKINKPENNEEESLHNKKVIKNCKKVIKRIIKIREDHDIVSTTEYEVIIELKRIIELYK